ncbi:phosphatases II [Panus rudis PR-1116 ss-1]|nr:phosphatases II [Panus rudis PR-1116 ss-1]
MSTTLLQVHSVTLPASTASTAEKSAQAQVDEPKEYSPDELLAAQLAHLASLHHESYYSRLKYGARGAAGIYIPMSLHMPDRVKELQIQQARDAIEQAWWYCGEPHRVALYHSGVQAFHSTPLLSRPATPALEDDLFEAIDSPLALDLTDFRPSTAPPLIHPQCKTSDSHPINISAIIPPELLLLISAHLKRAENGSPVMFDISPSKHLHFLIDRMRDPISIPAMTSVPSVNVRSISLATSTSTRSSDFLVTFWKQAFGRRKSNTSRAKRSGIVKLPSSPPPSEVDEPISCQAEEPSLILGNLYLSSCPGKKVRLSGPENGRSAIRRDLAQDLKRIKDSGIRCVVCCLDDAELLYLGAPWPEYQHAAHTVGLDVLRLPTPEGLAPLDPEVLDGHLNRLIDAYTLKGQHTLVHCRGGVGRAGLIACCWAVKLGLCGWIETSPRLQRSAASSSSESLHHIVRRDTLQLVERVLSVVRRRRSPKAVETYEQVKFLVDYVEFLRGRTAASNMGPVIGSLGSLELNVKSE